MPASRGLAKLAAFCIGCVYFFAPQPLRPGTAPRPQLPALVLWAWEMPEDLRALDADNVAAAALLDTIELTSPPRHLPRRQTLRLPAGTRLIATVRLQVPPRTAIALTPADYSALLESIAERAKIPGLAGLQIDFDATRSQRDFYRRLLMDLRPRLPSGLPLSITALGSWCMHDDWLGGLPVDDAIPMLFRMGADDRNLRAELAGGEDFRQPLCRHSFGVSTDEPLPALRSGRRIYLFNPKPWNAASIAKAEKEFTP